MSLVVTTSDRFEIVRRLPRRLQRRCEGLNPVSLRLALEAMQVPEREILQCAPPPPPPLGLARSIWSSGYPTPNSYPNSWQWLRPTIVNTSGGDVTKIPNQGGAGSLADAVVIASGVTVTGGTINGRTALSIPAGQDQGCATVGGGIPYTTFFNCTLFAVVQPSALGSFWGVYDDDSNNSFALATNATGAAWKFAMNVSSPPYGLCEGGVPAIGTAQLLTAIFVGSTHTATLQVNGVTVSTDTSMPAPTLVSSAPVALGGRPSVSVDGLPGLYWESAIFTDAKAGSDLLNLNRYFGSACGIPVP